MDLTVRSANLFIRAITHRMENCEKYGMLSSTFATLYLRLATLLICNINVFVHHLSPVSTQGATSIG